MKKSIIFVTLFFTGCFFCQASFAKELKIGYLNILEVFNEYTKTKTYDDALTKKAEAKEKELKDKQSEIEKMQNKLSVLKDKEKEKEQEKVEKSSQEFVQLVQQSRIDLRKEKDEKMKEVLEDIDKAIKDYAKKNGYDLILNEGHLALSPIVLYADGTMNITKDIIKILNDSVKK